MPKKDVKKTPAADDDADESDRDSDNDSDCGDDEPTRTRRSFDFTRAGKLAIFVVLLFFLLMSDVFIERVMGRINPGLIDGRIPTRRGIMVQGVLLAIGFIVFDFLITKEVL